LSAPCATVIVTSFNRAELLREAIQSVLDQDFQDFEIVVVDDGSEDHSLQVIESFREREPGRIRLCTHRNGENRGIQETHLLGIREARGEYIAFLDNDDYWSPDYLASKVALLRAHPEVAVVFSTYEVVGKGWFGRDMMLRQWLLRSTIRRDQPFDDFATLLRFNNVATFSCFVTRRSLLNELSEPTGNALLFDWWVLLRLSILGPFLLDRSTKTYWRWSRQSTMGQQHFKGLRNQACEFMAHMVREIDRDFDRLQPFQRYGFRRHQADFPYFLGFYRQPGLRNFTRFFMRAPVWATSSALSLVINYFKFC
jgi:glycosyltransferase involved in cell wall biosynthesis